METLRPPEIFFLQAAQGWLELGCPSEANDDLQQIKGELSDHLDVLKVRWGIFAAKRLWNEALALAGKIVLLEPGEPLGWVHLSYCLHEMQRTQEARDNLMRVMDRFPGNAMIHYNLACYECRLGDQVSAKKWLQSAFRIGNRSQMKMAAMEDPDLKPLWAELKAS